MKLTLSTLLTAGIGALLVWAGVTGRDPIAVIRSVLTGQPIPLPGALGSAVGTAGAEGARAGARAVRPE